MDEQLFSAIIANNLNRVRELVELGANIEARDKNGFTPLMLSFYTNTKSLEIARLLVELGANIDAAIGGHTLLMSVANLF